MSERKSLLKKRRRRSIIAFEMIRLDRTAGEQLYRQIRDELRSGNLPTVRLGFLPLGLWLLTWESHD
jgi:hypothetical protein